MSIEIKIDISKYPLLNTIKNENLENTINKLLKAGYDIYFPSENKIEKNIEYNQILEKIESKNQEFGSKMLNLETNLTKLINISSNSAKKGSFGENFLEELFSTRYGDIQFIKKNNIAHCGDAWLYLPNGQIIILESKNYNNIVNKDEITKLQSDMITNHITSAILVSFNSTIVGTKELDLITFPHNNETYTIITISNMSNDIHKLDLGLQIIRRLMTVFESNKFPWVVDNINNHLNELNNIVQKNYCLRDSYYTMEKDIQKSLSNYHIILRNYQYEIEKKINEIINNLKSSKVSEVPNYNLIIEKNNDKKIFPLLTRFLDVIQCKNWCVNFDEKSNEWIVSKDNNEIGKLKIQLKKISFITINELVINLQLEKEKENKNNIEILKIL